MISSRDVPWVRLFFFSYVIFDSFSLSSRGETIDIEEEVRL